MSFDRPVLRYHGGKWKLAPWIIQHMAKHTVYCEPYGGGANVLLRKDRVSAEIYNDLDSAIVNVFRVLQDPVKAESLRRRLDLTPYAREEFDRTYAVPVDDVEWACFVIARSFMGHGTDSVTRTCRTGFRSKVDRSLPSIAWGSWPSSVPAFVERLKGVVIEHRDAAEVIERADTEDTMFYVDPPYVTSTRSSLQHRSSATHGYAHELTDEHHAELARLLHRVKGMVLLSGYRSALYADLYRDWLCLERLALADGARERTECLWFNASAEARMPHGHLCLKEANDVTAVMTFSEAG